MAENIVLDRETTETSKNTACKIDNTELRKRTYALNLAANAVSQYLCETGLSVDTDLSLYKIPAFAKNLEIADIYIGRARLDVRVTFDEKIFYIPKIQEKYDAVPCAYIVTKLDSNLKNIEVLGFVSSAELEKQKSANEYYCYEASLLKPISELKDFLSTAKIQTDVPSPEEIEKTQELVSAFVDEEISESEKVYFIKNVVRFGVCREILCNLSNFDNLANQISKYEDLLNDSTLNVLSGNEEEVDKAFLANIATVENAEENLEETIEDTLEEPIEETIEEALPEVLEDTLEEAVEAVMETAEDIALTEAATALIAEETAVEEVVESISLPEVESEAENLLLEEFTESEETPVASLSEDEEEIIKPMGVLSLESESEATETQEISLNETAPEEVSAEESGIISDDLFVVGEELTLEETVEENVVENTEETLTAQEPVSDLLLTEDEEILSENTELDSLESVQEEETVLETADDIESAEPVQEEIQDSLEPELTISESSSDDFLLQENLEDSDDLLLNGVSELLEEDSIFAEQQTEEPKTTEEERKPFSIKLEGEEDEESLEEVKEVEEETSAIDIVEEVTEDASSLKPAFDIVEDEEPINEVNDLSELDTLSDLADDTSVEQQPAETEAVTQDSSNDSEIQSLLDDDLMALLSEGGDAVQEPASQTVENIEQPVADDNFSAFSDVQNDEQPVHEEEFIDSEQNDETIGTLFETGEQTEDGEEKQFELAQEPVSENRVSAVKNLAVAGVLVLFLAGASTAAWFMNHSKVNNNTVDTANQQDDEMFNLQNNAVTNEDEQMPALSQDINKSMTNSFSDKPAAITITKLSWQVSEKLAAENSVKEYLQTAGKNIQINLQNDLANSADINFNNSIKISFEIAPDNTMKGMQVLESSGSDQVDEIVLRSIKNTLKYVSVPKLANFNSDFFLTLLINF